MAVAVGIFFFAQTIRAKSFGDGIQEICKNTKSNLGPFADF